MPLILVMHALAVLAGCAPTEEKFMTTADLRGVAGASLHLLGEDGTPVRLLAVLDYPNEENRLPDGRCWTSEILATANDIPMETIYQGRWLNQYDCRGGWYELPVADHPELADPDQLTVRYYDASGELVVKVYRFFDTPTVSALNSPMAGEVGIIEVLPATEALGAHFTGYFSGSGPPSTPDFFFGEDTPGVVIDGQTIQFPVPAGVEPATGWVSVYPTDTSGAFFARVDDCSDFLDCRAIRGACAGVTCSSRVFQPSDWGYDGQSLSTPFEVQ